MGAIAGRVGKKNQWQLEFHPLKKAFVDGKQAPVHSEEPSQYDRVVITARSVIETIASARLYRCRSAKLDNSMRTDPEHLATLSDLRFATEDC